MKEIDHIKQAKPMATMYSKAYKTVINVYVDFFCIMNYQPERRKNLGLALGNSTLHKRMGYIMDYKQLVDVIRSCKLCTLSILDEYSVSLGARPKPGYRWRKRTCKKCSSWLYNMDDTLLSYNADPSYLNGCLPTSGKMKPKIITRHNIDEAIELVHDGLKYKKLKNMRHIIYCDILVCVVMQLIKLS